MCSEYSPVELNAKCWFSKCIDVLVDARCLSPKLLNEHEPQFRVGVFRVRVFSVRVFRVRVFRVKLFSVRVSVFKVFRCP